MINISIRHHRLSVVTIICLTFVRQPTYNAIVDKYTCIEFVCVRKCSLYQKTYLMRLLFLWFSMPLFWTVRYQHMHCVAMKCLGFLLLQSSAEHPFLLHFIYIFSSYKMFSNAIPCHQTKSDEQITPSNGKNKIFALLPAANICHIIIYFEQLYWDSFFFCVDSFDCCCVRQIFDSLNFVRATDTNVAVPIDTACIFRVYSPLCFFSFHSFFNCKSSKNSSIIKFCALLSYVNQALIHFDFMKLRR